MELYCPFCDKQTRTSNIDVEKSYRKNGVLFNYYEIEYRCTKCSSVIHKNDDDFSQALKEYQLANDLLTGEEIKDIRQSRGFTLKSFYKSFGINPFIISQYEKGLLIQTHQHNLLFELLMNPRNLQRYLPILKENLNTGDFQKIQKTLCLTQPTLSTMEKRNL